MEFFYDEQALSNDDPQLKKGQDEKTEKAFHILEDEVSKQYDKTANVLKSFVAEGEEGVKFNIPLDPEMSQRAQRYLGQLDSNLQNAEKMAQGYWTKVSNPMFWSTVTNSLSTKFEQVVKLDEDGSEQATSKAVVGGNRTETELRTLSTDKSIYMNNKTPVPENFDVDDKTEEISKILEKDKDLAHLMNDIVPHGVPYKDFWSTYFTQRQRILEMENTRRKILENGEAPNDEEIAWDEEEEENDRQEEEPVIIKKEDTEHEELKNWNDDAALSKDAKTKEEEDDDDWE